MLSMCVVLMMTYTYILDDLVFYYDAVLNHNDYNDSHCICIHIWKSNLSWVNKLMKMLEITSK